MRLPRDLSGAELARLLRHYGYEPTRQSSSHVRLTSTMMGTEHHVTIPAHAALKVGTLHAILADVAGYLGLSVQDVLAELLGR